MKTFSAYITAHAKAIVVIWLIIFLAMAYFALQLPGKLQGDGFLSKQIIPMLPTS